MSSSEVGGSSSRVPGQRVVRVAVNSPLRKTFDYLSPASPSDEVRRGARVLVPFGRAPRIGVVIDLDVTPEVSPDKLKPITKVLPASTHLDEPLLKLLEWSASYYHHPIGEVVVSALPVLLREARRAKPPRANGWQLTEVGRTADLDGLSRAPKQLRVVEHLRQTALPLSPAGQKELGSSTASLLRQLEAKGWVERVVVEVESTSEQPFAHQSASDLSVDEPSEIVLNADQRSVIERITASGNTFACFCLLGVTGSGKTEVYIELARNALRTGRQALVLIPEIGLTPQLVSRFVNRLDTEVDVLHSGLSDRERREAWSAAAEGRAGLVVGTRSAVFSVMPKLGVIIVDEEHDQSFKQQEGFRYHARDVAVRRAHLLDIPVVLGSATPSMETMRNVAFERYKRVDLPDRVAGRQQPELEVIDLRASQHQHGLTAQVRNALVETVERQEQALLFVNRRGFAPTLVCQSCGWYAACEHCDAKLVMHRRAQSLHCHHCGAVQPLPLSCPECKTHS